MRFFQRRPPAHGVATSQKGVAQSEAKINDTIAQSAQNAPAQEGVTERRRRLPEISLNCATWGTQAPDRAVLLVHGLTASSREWMVLGPALAAEGMYVIAPDLRGRGRSDKPAHGYSLAIHAADLLGLADALGLTTFQVVGHSLGAAIGMYLAVIAPERVTSLVMVDAGGKIPDDTAQAIAASVARLGTVYPSLDAYLTAMRQLPMLTWNAEWEAYFRYDAELRPDGTVVSCVPKTAIEEESLALSLTRTEALPELVRSPTLIVRAPVGLLGPDRGLILPREEAERLKEVMPICEVIEVEGTNHYTVVQAPAFLESVRQFLGAHVTQN